MDTTSKYCASCGMGLTSEVRFCTSCGFEVELPTQHTITPQEQTISEEPMRPIQPTGQHQYSVQYPHAGYAKKSNKKVVLICAAIAVALLAVVGAVVLFADFGNDADTYADAEGLLDVEVRESLSDVETPEPAGMPTIEPAGPIEIDIRDILAPEMSAAGNHPLVGTWFQFMNNEVNNNVFYVFNSDGSGTFTMVDFPELSFDFTWNVVEEDRIIFLANMNETLWFFEINDETLALAPIIDGTVAFTFTYLKIEDSNISNYIITPNDETLGSAIEHVLLGTWAWTINDSYQYVFYADGTGKRGLMDIGLYEIFDWKTEWIVVDSAGTLIISSSVPLLMTGQYEEEWLLIITSNTLSLGLGGAQYIYRRVE